MIEHQSHDVLKQIVERITEHFQPESIVLFGSYARGTANADSDADLLVVMNVAGSKRKQAIEIDLCLQGIPIPTDVIVVTPEDIEKYRDCPSAIIHDAIREGKVLYERAA